MPHDPQPPDQQSALPQRTERESWGFRHRGWIGICLLAPVALLTLFSKPGCDRTSPLGIAIQSLGWISFLAGGSLRFWSTLYVGGRKHKSLVTEGPYSVCRNPLYLATFLIALSVGLFLRSATLVGAAMVVLVGYASITVSAEERFLRGEFGEVYEKYLHSVPRFFPRLRTFSSPRWIQVDTRALAKEWRKAATWLFIPVLVAVFDALRLQPWWPHWFMLP